MKQNIFKIFISICLIFLGYTFCYYQHKQDCVEDIVKEVQVIKEKIVRDTIFCDRPIYINKQIVRTDTIQVYDVKHDSVDVILPVIQKEYRDSTYSAWVSGYQDVNLDSIQVYQKNIFTEINNTKYVTKYKNRPFSLGIQVGYGFDFMNRQCSPYVGVGLQYNIISFGKR